MTESTIAKILSHVRIGSSFADAAFLAGVDETTVHRWHAKGLKCFAAGILDRPEHRDFDYCQFYQRLELAKREGKALLIGRVNAGTTKDHRFALEVLGRRFPKEWGPKIGVVDETPVKRESPREKLLQQMAAIADRQKRAAEAIAEVQRGLAGARGTVDDEE